MLVFNLQIKIRNWDDQNINWENLNRWMLNYQTILLFYNTMNY